MLFSYTSIVLIVSLWFTGIRSPSVDDTITSRAEVKTLTFSLNSMVNHPRSQYLNASFMTLRHTRLQESADYSGFSLPNNPPIVTAGRNGESAVHDTYRGRLTK